MSQVRARQAAKADCKLDPPPAPTTSASVERKAEKALRAPYQMRKAAPAKPAAKPKPAPAKKAAGKPGPKAKTAINLDDDDMPAFEGAGEEEEDIALPPVKRPGSTLVAACLYHFSQLSSRLLTCAVNTGSSHSGSTRTAM